MKTTSQFIQKSKKIHGEKYDYSRVNYIKSKHKVEIICNVHGVFLQRPNDHLQGKGCPKCKYLKSSATKTLTNAEFIDKAIKVHGEKYNYSLVAYKRCNLNVKIICSKHGEFEQRAINHLSGHGCPRCKSEKIASCRKCNTDIEFISKACKIHGQKYDYSKIQYAGWDIPIEIICPKHGTFFQIPSVHLQNHGCSKCNSSKGELKILEWLEYHKMNYVQQKTFDNCRSIKNGLLRFDFYLPNKNILIEFDGKQHFVCDGWVSNKHKITNSQFDYLRQCDEIKNDYARREGICFVRISHNDISNIPQVLNSILLDTK